MATAFGKLFTQSGTEMLFRQFGEAVEYVPANGSQRLIFAIIERDVGFIGEADDVNAQATMVRVRMRSSDGILSTEVNTAKDAIRYAVREGDEPQLKRIVRVVSTDNGVMQMMVQ